MPSDTETMVPSLRASAAELDLLDAALDQFADFGRVELGLHGDFPLVVRRCRRRGLRDEWFQFASAPCRLRELAAHGTVDDDVAGVDHRAADQRRVDRRG
jgi:hypothetical protein